MSKNIIIVLFFIIVLCYYSTVCKHLFNNFNYINKFKLPDLLHIILPDTSNYNWIGDYMVALIVIVFISLAIYKKKYNIIFKWIKLIAITIIIKSIMMSVTILPDPSGKCELNFKNSVPRGYCNDLIFSGHMTVTIITLLFLYHHELITNKIILLLYFLLTGFQIISSKNHYTIDVLISIIVSLNVFYFKKFI